MGYLLLLLLSAAVAFGDSSCLPCHKAETEAYGKTGMARSISTWKSSGGSFDHPSSKSRLLVKAKGKRMVHRIERGGLISEQPVALTIGSGNVGQSFAVTIGDRVYESPASWFSQRGRWGVSPGYENDVAPDFDRRIEAECLYCHTSGFAASLTSLAPISCDRCHVASAKHFAIPDRDRVCESCHLQGEARILHPGSSWEDGNPAFTTYVSSTPATGLKVVSQVEQLALSKCVVADVGKLSCSTCHSPHGPSVSIQQVCTSCHGVQLSRGHSSYRGKCVECHMPRQSTPEVAHTAYTDHRIQLPGSREPVQSGGARSLRAWREHVD